MSWATRPLWPAVVGSRASMAVTEAWTNPSKSRRNLVGELGVLDGGRGLRAQALEELLVVGGEGGAIAAVQDLKHAHHRAAQAAIGGAELFPAGHDHRHGEEVVGAVAGGLVDRPVEARVLVSLGDVDGLAGLGHVAGNAHPEGGSDLLGPHALREASPEVPPLPVDEEDGAAVGLGHLGAGVENDSKEAVQVAFGGQGAGHPKDEIELFGAALEGRGHASGVAEWGYLVDSRGWEDLARRGSPPLRPRRCSFS